MDTGVGYPLGPGLARVAGLLCIVVAGLGAAGNLLTLLAIPWAQRHKKLGFHRTPLKAGRHMQSRYLYLCPSSVHHHLHSEPGLGGLPLLRGQPTALQLQREYGRKA